MPDLIPLEFLAAGDRAEVAQVVGHPEQVRRVRELGFQEGTPIDMVRGGATCIIRLSGQTLCWRERTAQRAGQAGCQR